MEAHKLEEEFKKYGEGLRFLWMELTSSCNLYCTHCYSNSKKGENGNSRINDDLYFKIIEEAFKIGCKKIQFTGGEPTLHTSLIKFIQKASELGYEFIEVYTNAYNIPKELIKVFKSTNTYIATTIYSSNTEVHDSITRTQNSLENTVKNLIKILDEKIPVRVSIIVNEKNRNGLEKTIEWLKRLGVYQIRIDKVRRVGRGKTEEVKDLKQELCGKCWQGTLAISPEGNAYPCIFSREFKVGNIFDSSLKDIIYSEKLKKIRKEFYTYFKTRAKNLLECNPNTICGPETVCGPDILCNPTVQCAPNCVPGCSPLVCAPWVCTPCAPGCGP